MTAPDLDALAALLAKATPGPWRIALRASYYHYQIAGHGRDGREDERVCITTDAIATDAPPDVREANAELIVAAVNALPGLLARVRELEQDAARLEWFAHECRRRDSSIRLADGTFKTCTAWAIASADDDLRAAIDAARKAQP